MELTINSKKLKCDVTFSRPGSGYIYVDFTGNKPGTLGKQICDGGSLRGSTISYRGDDPDAFDNICRRWWKSYIKNY